MAIVLKLTFPAGRYHATPWGRHVNEGVPEWPPSPWRLLRALVAVWRRTRRDDLSEEDFRRIIEPLLAAPSFRLPAHRVAHTRHYMPWHKNGPESRTLVFDTFVALGRLDPLFVIWPEAELAVEDRERLAGLVANLTSLGRAESWVVAELVAAADGEPNCRPDRSTNSVRVLCADASTALGDEYYPKHDPRTIKKGIKPAGRLFDCPPWHLCLDTETIHDRRWSGVPGSVYRDYNRPPEVVLTARRLSPAVSRTYTIARFALDGPVLPAITQTLPLAEAVRAQLLQLTGQKENRHDSIPAFWGKDENNSPLQGHRHAFFLPVDEDNDGFLDHVVVFAPMGFQPPERQALDRLRRLLFRLGRDDHGLDLVLALVGLGEPSDFAGSRLLGPSAVWESATPYSVTRHLKARARHRDPDVWFADAAGHAAFVQSVLTADFDRHAGVVPEGAKIMQIESLLVTPWCCMSGSL